MILAIYYVALVGIFLPVACIRSYYKLKAGAPYPPKLKLHRQTLLMHAMFLAIALFIAKSLGIVLFPAAAPRVSDIALGAGVLITFVSAMYPLWKYKAARQPEKIYRRLPQSYSELGLWSIVSLSAGFVEEIAYRGVLFQLIFYWVGNWWIAALFAAISFALGHAIQGWKSTLIIFAFAVAFQGLVWATGTLYVAMAVHAIYDFVAGFAYAILYKKSAIEPMAGAETA
ncbi:MAG TPA: CPBP family intramembrane glutamic endopeptidase [Candidatus Acidoferrales bacterium]|nr:CPBP family intramembrane glutamic endopeptidase [Candidatus Acidoferrales bacterium]